MPSFRTLLDRLGRRREQPQPGDARGAAAVPEGPRKNVARFEPLPEFSTRLPVDAAGAPGRAGAEALYQKWAGAWQEF
jgi:hypothetical protein